MFTKFQTLINYYVQPVPLAFMLTHFMIHLGFLHITYYFRLTQENTVGRFNINEKYAWVGAKLPYCGPLSVIAKEPLLLFNAR